MHTSLAGVMSTTWDANMMRGGRGEEGEEKMFFVMVVGVM